MKLLPVALKLQDRPCLVVGGGRVAGRKVFSLLECEARVTVVSPDLCLEMANLAGAVRHESRPYEPADCMGKTLIFACTDNPEVNRRVAADALALGILCDSVNDAEAGDFHSMAVVRRGEICIGIGTGGGSPALARHLASTVEQAVGVEYEQLLEMVSRLQACGSDGQGSRAAIWHDVLQSQATELLRQGLRPEAEATVREIVGRTRKR